MVLPTEAPRADRRREGVTGSSAARLYQEIVENALAALGVRFVNLSGYDAARNEVYEIAWAGGPNALFRRAIDSIRAVLPAWAIEGVRFSADANPWVHAIHVERRSVMAPFAEVAERTTHPSAVWAANMVLGLKHTLSVPLIVADAVGGSLAFHGVEPFDESARRTGEAFARQAALTLENARLTAELREQVGALQRAREEVARHAEEARLAQRRVTEAEERMRREVAELLHGRVQTRLVMASYKLGGYEREAGKGAQEAGALVESVKREIDELAEQDIRRASHLLHPGVIRMGLVPALHLLAERVEPALRVEVRPTEEVVRLDDPMANALDEALRLAVYRIAEEALSNVLRHAEAKTARVEISVDGAAAGRVLTLRVSDDGKGIDPAALQARLGLASIDGRVREVNGAWSLDGAPGRGATLTARLPLADA
ncbi:MAG TPA: ATP-binding protein [Chloroflexota bacterium]|nr:ATP-binding protein [Chloroflexota bacterium]